MKYQLLKLGVEVSINSNHPKTSALIEFSGDESAIAIARDALASCYGRNGRLITDSAAPSDLEVAMLSQSMQKFKPVKVEESI